MYFTRNGVESEGILVSEGGLTKAYISHKMIPPVCKHEIGNMMELANDCLSGITPACLHSLSHSWVGMSHQAHFRVRQRQ